MNDGNFDLCERHVPRAYIQQGREARKVLEKKIKILLEQGKLPNEGWSDIHIKHFLNELSLMDSNNFQDNCGVGEREARIASPMVAERHFSLGHGIGRSGDIAAVQPKAAGSSVIAKLTNSFALDVLKLAGVSSVKGCLVVPVATGMALVLTMRTLKEQRPHAKYVIWPRIDQKSCFKSILTAGFQPIIVENILKDGHLETDVDAIERVLETIESEEILCVMTTTSCFAPRLPDKLEEVGVLCKKYSVAHIVNNAYGIQSSKCMHLIQQAWRVGRLDAFVQSTDKNFMVPVGGSLIATFDKQLCQNISSTYPGRASSSPIMDLFITLLSLGAEGYKEYLRLRKENYNYLLLKLQEVVGEFDEEVIDTKHNQISIAITLKQLKEKLGGDMVTEFGSYLFKRSVSGTRAVTGVSEKAINSHVFVGWGAHCNTYPYPYLTAAASIGVTRLEIDQFIKRLRKAFVHFYKEQSVETIGSNKREDLKVNIEAAASSQQQAAFNQQSPKKGGQDFPPSNVYHQSPRNSGQDFSPQKYPQSPQRNSGQDFSSQKYPQSPKRNSGQDFAVPSAYRQSPRNSGVYDFDRRSSSDHSDISASSYDNSRRQSSPQIRAYHQQTVAAQAPEINPQAHPELNKNNSFPTTERSSSGELKDETDHRSSIRSMEDHVRKTIPARGEPRSILIDL